MFIEYSSIPSSLCRTIPTKNSIPCPTTQSGTGDFDATTVDPDMVELGGSGVAFRGKSNKYMAHEEDVNGDGLIDLVVQVAVENLDPDTFQDGYTVLTGSTYDGQSIEGSDEIRIVPQ